jgi:putative glycosyltransferase (TIGR04372 family)
VLTINAAHGPYNFSINNKMKFFKVIYPNHLEYKEVFRLRQKKYCNLRALTPDFYPLKTEKKLSTELVRITENDKYIVIQIKLESVNGTWQAIDPSSLIDTIKEILSHGYKVVFAGREKMPYIFNELGVINYSESKNATPENDYLLILNASAVIASASGFAYISDVLDIPLLTINLVTISAYPGRKTIFIPSLLSKNATPMNFKDQLEYIYKRGQITKNNKIESNISCKDASSEEILLAFKELLFMAENTTIPKLTNLQMKFKNHFPLELTSQHHARISDAFIRNHQNRY